MYTKKDLLIAFRMGAKGLSFPMVEEVLGDYEDTSTFTLEKLLRMVCNYYKVEVSEVVSESRKQILINARSMYSYFATEVYGAIQEDASRLLKKDRTTLIHYKRKVKGYLDINDEVTVLEFNQLKEKLENVFYFRIEEE
jgi:chromosomal replication initiation ATPase DnaA